VSAKRIFLLSAQIVSGVLLTLACTGKGGGGSSVQPPSATAPSAAGGGQTGTGGVGTIAAAGTDIVVMPEPDSGLTQEDPSAAYPPTALPAGGEVSSAGFDPTNKTKFAAPPTGAAAPTVVYPLAHALFPANIAPVEIHLKRTVVAQTIARVSFHVAGFDLSYFDTCQPAEVDPTGCVIALPAAVCKTLGDANYFGALSTTIRLADTTGGNVGETTLDSVSWTFSNLSGGLYYWTTIVGGASATAIKRYNFDAATGVPEIYWAQDPDSPQVTGTQADGGAHACMGCHAISRDGTKIAMSLGGSQAAAFELVDVASKMPIAQRLDTTAGYAEMTTFSPDGSEMINSHQGKLLLRSADAALSDIAELFAADTMDPKSHPFWSPTGDSVTFVSFLPTGDAQALTDDLVPNAQIWLAPSDGKAITGPATALVPRSMDQANYYPAISDDGKFMVFNRSLCSGPASANWGSNPCDGYDDISARLMVVPVSGGTPVDLTLANGEPNVTNSWPRWSPDHGEFNKTSIYWVAFSSRRAYGLRLAGATAAEPEAAKPQLWFAAVRATPGQPLEMDPSFAPVWLPGQNADMTNPTGNHIPQWVKHAVPIVVK
jgi:hypothetical protein